MEFNSNIDTIITFKYHLQTKVRERRRDGAKGWSEGMERRAEVEQQQNQQTKEWRQSDNSNPTGQYQPPAPPA
jgi:hypothetical protein